jgi:hypothetical protein
LPEVAAVGIIDYCLETLTRNYMSQTAESARDWINNAAPSIEQLQNAATAIQRKIQDHPSLDEETRQNLSGALEEVTVELQAQQYATEEESDKNADNVDSAAIDSAPLGSNSVVSSNLDTGELGESGDPTVRALQGDAKRAAFEALKNTLKS